VKSPADSDETVTPFRVSQDYRKKGKPKRPYPGARTHRPRTPYQEAELNLTYVWAGSSKSSRFSNGRWSVLYTAARKTTSYVEVGYHLQNYYLPAKMPGMELEIPHICYRITAKGRQRSYMHCATDYDNLCDSSSVGYSRCQNIAIFAMKDKMDFLCVPSSRAPYEKCFPVFSQNNVSKPRDVDEVFICLTDDWSSIRVQAGKTKRRYLVSRKH
jgi:hypothetical protein